MLYYLLRRPLLTAPKRNIMLKGLDSGCRVLGVRATKSYPMLLCCNIIDYVITICDILSSTALYCTVRHSSVLYCTTVLYYCTVL